ncbi:MAG: bifunctional 5,10-methylenetetrahydrofolate dehydrogenase/5,10-methenyltetrahydrofolate cyclohydrolase [Cyclobacteriaceae bacterium]|nr:bifunctional 5,10-methylenetetrahydrofolate dehydrogenase/5,10-methenyltetrahydrofolate cyclohydrolase [Cyclobacteriaceae bacterium]
MTILDGKKIASDIENEISLEVQQLLSRGGRAPHLAAILVGDDGPSLTYVDNKVKACKRVGFESTLMKFSSTMAEEKLLKEIVRFNEDEDIDGFIVQLPLPAHISEEKVIETIAPEKDVDGFTNQNYGRIISPHHGLLPATPYGVMELLRRYKIPTKGKHAVVVGHSRVVGAPMGLLLAHEGQATVTQCHIDTHDLGYFTRQADILCVAVGKPNLITADMVKEGVVVVDVGINRVEDATKKRGYRLAGDVNFDEVAKKASFITPVPGGVGPMTIASLLLNTLHASKVRTEGNNKL